MKKNLTKLLCSLLISIMLLQIALTVAQPVAAAAAFTTTPMVATAGGATIALKADGTVWTWGNNKHGLLGDGTTIDRYTPSQIQGLTNIKMIANSGSHMVALKSDGTVWTWGYNYAGQLGNGTTTDSLTPVQVPGLTGVTAISACNLNTYALKSDGTVWAWLDNNYGQLGDGTINYSRIPVQVKSLTTFTSVAAGWDYALALGSNGTVWAWGGNYWNQLGNGTTTNSLTPVQVPSLADVTAISASHNNSCALALKSDGTVWAWGSILGAIRTTPEQVKNPKDIVAIADSCVLKSDGTVWTWGSNNHGQLGDGTTKDRITFAQVIGLTGVIAVSGSNYHTAVIKSDGTVWAWGYNKLGGLGDGATTDRHTPVQVVGENGIGYFNVYNTTTTPTARTVTYNFSANGGTSATKTTATVNEGAAIDLTPTATKPGWAFVGWNTSQSATTRLSSLTMGGSNVTLYAIYSKTLTGNFKDATGMRTATTTIYNKATSGSVTAPSVRAYSGWTSRGWGTGTAADAATTTNYSITAAEGTKNFYGLYQRTLTLSYNGNNSAYTPPASRTSTQYTNSYNLNATKNPSFTLAAAMKRYHCTFNQWAQGSTSGTKHKAGATISIANNTTMYATWNVIPLANNMRFSFNNSPDYFTKGADNKKWVSDSDFNKLCSYAIFGLNHPNSKKNDLQTERNKKWEGSCYGMTAATLLHKSGQINFINYADSGKANMYAVSPPMNKPQVRSAINYYQISQSVMKPYTDCHYKTHPNFANAIQELINRAKTNEPIFFSYWFNEGGKQDGHTIVITGYDSASHRLIGYDNRSFPTTGNTFIHLSSNNKTMKVNNKEDVTAFAYLYATEMKALDVIKIDGIAPTIKTSSKDMSEKTFIKFTLNQPTITVKNNDGQTLTFDSSTLQYSGSLKVHDINFIVNSTADGQPAPTTVMLEVDSSSSFAFNGDGLDVAVISPNIYASATAEQANQVIVRNGEGVTVKGAGNFDYKASLGVNNNIMDMVSAEGNGKNGESSLKFQGDGVVAAGNHDSGTNFTVFSDTVDMKDIPVNASYDKLLVAGNGSGIAGAVDILGSSKGNGVYDVSLLHSWTKTILGTKYKSTFLNWLLFFLGFGWIWMWF